MKRGQLVRSAAPTSDDVEGMPAGAGSGSPLPAHSRPGQSAAAASLMISATASGRDT